MKNKFKFYNSFFVGPYLLRLSLKPEEIEKICLHYIGSSQLNKLKKKNLYAFQICEFFNGPLITHEDDHFAKKKKCTKIG